MSRTVPQIIMLGHASHIQSERVNRRLEAKKKQMDTTKQYEDENPIVFNGKRLEELNSSEMGHYYSSFGG